MGQLPQQHLNYAAPNPAPGIRFGRGLFGWLLFIGLAVMLFMVLDSGKGSLATLPLGVFVQRLEAKQVTSIVIDGDKIIGTITGGQRFRTPLPPGMSGDWSFVQWLIEKSQGTAVVEVHNPNNVWINILLPLVPWLLIFLFIWFFVFRQVRKASCAQPSAAAAAAAVPTVATPAGPGRWVPDGAGKAGQA